VINKENLQIFTYEVLKYKTNVIVVDFKIIGNSINIIFDSSFGEVVNLNKFKKWFLENRDKKINEIIL
jgi:hypothetical protein